MRGVKTDGPKVSGIRGIGGHTGRAPFGDPHNASRINDGAVRIVTLLMLLARMILGKLSKLSIIQLLIQLYQQ